MLWFLSWLVAVELLGLAVLPLAVHLFSRLPDRGYLFAKPLGILVVGYACWLLGVFGMLRFQRATVAVLLVALGVVCWAAWGRFSLKHLSSALPAIWFSEGLFVLCLAAAALVRAFNPEISGTEKPMDFALLNGIHRSEVLPPEDPWMSGHSISYYYFGYLLLAMVAKLSAVPASVAYNLGVALAFALLLAGVHSLAFNALSALDIGRRISMRLVAALLAPLMVGVMGNLEIGFEVLAARGFGDPSFWQWVGIKGLQPALEAEGWFPTSHWWWWRASRIIPTIKPDGINEFPYFSFLLGDLHPHFTALPWALLAVALSMAAPMGAAARKPEVDGDWLWVVVPALSLGFLLVGNSWDFPTYTALFWLAVLAGSARKPIPAVRRLALTSVCSVLLYWPFLLGFSSQTRGIGLSADKTPLLSMLIIFGPFFFILTCFLIWRAWPSSREQIDRRARARRRALVGVGASLIFISWFVGTTALLLGLLVMAGAAYRLRLVDPEAEGPAPAAEGFLLLAVFLGLLLVLVPEYLFLVDLFGTRMNTVFKFHYQAWLMLGFASAVSAAWMLTRMRPLAARWFVVGGAALLLCVALLYPVAATLSKTQNFRVRPTLDGTAFYQTVRAEDYAAIRWLAQNVPGRPVVLEATGGEYSEYARVSTFSGLPTVLGWAGHEVQWRGRGEEPRQRAQDIEAMYRTADRATTMELLEKYRVEYVFVGSLEISLYGSDVAQRFDGLLEPVYRQGRVTIYKVPGWS